MTLFDRILQQTEKLGHIAKTLRDNPQIAFTALEKQSPWLARQALSRASDFLEPRLLGMGLEVKEWTDERIWVRLPKRQRNANSFGDFSSGSLVMAAEFSLLSLLSRHFDTRFSSLEIRGLELEVHETARGELWFRSELLVSERAHWLSQGKSPGHFEVAILNPSEKLIGRVRFQVILNSSPALTSSRGS